MIRLGLSFVESVGRVILAILGCCGIVVFVFMLSGPMLFPLISTSFGRAVYPDLRESVPFIVCLVVSIYLAAMAPRGSEARRVQVPGLVGAGLVILPAGFIGAAFWQSLDDAFGSCAFPGCWPSLTQQVLIAGAWTVFAALLVVHGWKLAPRPRYLALIPLELAGVLGLYFAVWAILFHGLL